MSRMPSRGSHGRNAGPYMQSIPNDDDACPDYEAAVSRSNSNVTSEDISNWSDVQQPLNVQGQASNKPSANFRRYVYTYNMLAAQTPIQFYITVEPHDGKPTAGQYQFRLSMRVNGVERLVGESISRIMSVDPRKLEFAVFMFPGKNAKQVLPLNSLWSLRVWLRVDGVDHQLFKVDDLFVGKDLDFNSIGDASFARHAGLGQDYQVYKGYVGKALITFTVRWHRIRDRLYKYSFEYEGGGVGDILLSDFRMRIDNDPRSITFLIYSIPVQSMPVGATHRIRIWLRGLVPLTNDPIMSQPLPFNDSYIYQRVFQLDDFKVGGRLEFHALGNKLVMAFPHCGGPETVQLSRPPVKPQDKDKDKERGKELPVTSFGSQSNHDLINPNPGVLPPGAQRPIHSLSPQGTISGSAVSHYHPQLPNHIPISLQPVRRERERAPTQVQKTRTRVDIV
ncbi:hypothetical protein AGABI1DRAFT_113213 [Agaricus bisporus var. burnettii JB137-S8]|uniref:Uncharacterized protein n=1 Tax=Agaricus bisporus var. burnettii (strain JB137-S8 / ATCC MYA-4627 / FGSC 10392) TaxID=597362 RepID=K5X9Q3_AGABU|nr:uncharacterized protein AGABI1DRAFT_113213 [Agaricus bisporus var. burnettii JB137-S8]EKM79968.1 hypothetical protein AGABI1DRAFT_113213 [Agaricus bisporus var. burnettii JB137-S8]